MKYDADYSEEVTLRDGTVATLRLVRPEDKPLFVEGFTRLSSESRYLRFFTGKDHLSEAELRYLTELDGMNHLAIGARTGERGLGVCRFVRLQDEPEVAELAVTVVDDCQKKGLGRILCERTVEAARERGILRCRAEILGSNVGMLALMRDLSPTIQREEGGSLLVDFELPQPVPASPGLIARILELAARGLIAVRRAFD